MAFSPPNPWRCCMWKHNTLVRSLHSLCWHWAACAAPLGYGNAGRSHLLHIYFWMRCGGIISWNDLCFTLLVFKVSFHSHTKSSKSKLIKLAGYFKLWVQKWALESASTGVGVWEKFRESKSDGVRRLSCEEILYVLLKSVSWQSSPIVIKSDCSDWPVYWFVAPYSCRCFPTPCPWVWLLHLALPVFLGRFGVEPISLPSLQWRVPMSP